MDMIENNNNTESSDDYGIAPIKNDDEPSINDNFSKNDEPIEEKSIYDLYENHIENEPNLSINENHAQKSSETEVSIYEIHKTESDVNKTFSDKLEAYENFTYSSEEKKICFVGNDIEDLPTELIYLFGLKALILDVSFNNLTELKDISQFPYLEELICDNNLITENSTFPNLPNLKLFSCNKNKIRDIQVFIDKIKHYYPKIVYLSLLGNAACPNQLIDETKDEYDYFRYRLYVIYRLPTLKFLDSHEVTALEREEAIQQSQFLTVVSYKDEDDQNLASNEEKANKLYTPLANSNELGTSDDPKASFGFCKYVYYGKQSEGNRFIKNDDL